MVMFEPGQGVASQQGLAAAAEGFPGLKPVSSFEELGISPAAGESEPVPGQQVNQSALHRFYRGDGAAAVDPAQQAKSLPEGVASVSPVYCLDADDPHTYFGLRVNILVVEPEPGADRDEVRGLLEETGLTVDEQRSRYLSGKLLVTLDGEKDPDAVRRELLQDDRIRKVLFEKVPLLSPSTGLPNDPLYPQQWNLPRIEWHADYQGCTQTTVIAVIDEGCDLDHPDLNFASPGLNLATMMPDGSPTGNHGTACAGIAAATTGNGQGVAGVAGLAKILPLAVVTWSDVEVASGINYAVSFGADVISMSFGVYDSWGFWNYDLIDPEIVFATNHSVFLCAASGNENLSTLNRYPGKNPLVLCVGGSNKDDLRKAVGDALEGFWGACWGLEDYEGSLVGVDVVAPCLHIPTTDILGGGGYSGGDYYDAFNGTSSATPQVAGLAALIKSVLPDAGNSLVKKIIEKSADKIGTYAYSYWPEFPNSPWTQAVGHGRINVRRALDLARRYCCSDPCCCGGKAHEPIAFSTHGKGHVSKGAPVPLEDFDAPIINTGSGWHDGVFTVPEDGIYSFDWSFVKDCFYHDGTQDDVTVYLEVNGVTQLGNAWSGEGAGKRGTGTSNILVQLETGDEVRLMVRSDGNKNRHLAYYSISGHRLAA